MFTVFFIMLSGMAMGFILRNTALPRYLDKCIQLAILLLLFALGIAVGANDTVMNNLPVLGWQALVLTVAALTGSIAAAMLLTRMFFKK